MMKNNNDILSSNPELKKMPFSAPEGYFDSFKMETKRTVPGRTGFWNRVAPYAAMAAAFVFIVTAGTYLLEKSTSDYQMTEEDYLLFSENAMTTIAYDITYGDQIADAEILEEDIINYVIYTGISIEEIEIKYNK